MLLALIEFEVGSSSHSIDGKTKVNYSLRLDGFIFFFFLFVTSLAFYFKRFIDVTRELPVGIKSESERGG